MGPKRSKAHQRKHAKAGAAGSPGFESATGDHSISSAVDRDDGRLYDMFGERTGSTVATMRGGLAEYQPDAKRNRNQFEVLESLEEGSGPSRTPTDHPGTESRPPSSAMNRESPGQDKKGKSTTKPAARVLFFFIMGSCPQLGEVVLGDVFDDKKLVEELDKGYQEKRHWASKMVMNVSAIHIVRFSFDATDFVTVDRHEKCQGTGKLSQCVCIPPEALIASGAYQCEPLTYRPLSLSCGFMPPLARPPVAPKKLAHIFRSGGDAKKSGMLRVIPKVTGDKPSAAEGEEVFAWGLAFEEEIAKVWLDKCDLDCSPIYGFGWGRSRSLALR